jgi:hypothetical protein
VDQALAGGLQHGTDERGDAAEEIDADQPLAAEGGQLGSKPGDVLAGVVGPAVEQNPAVLGDGGRPMDLLGRVDSHADCHMSCPPGAVALQCSLAGRQRHNQRSIAQSNQRSSEGDGTGRHAA